jgi:Tfp pilus assembly protein PilN
MSAVQFNLLPDVKMHSVKIEHSRKLIITVAALVSAVCLALFFILLFSVDVVQKKQLNDADKQVTVAIAKINSIPNLNKILTINNQLSSLTTLHKNKHITSRLFGYLTQVTPTSVQISSINLDLSQNKMTITGTSDSHHSVNTFIDTLKFTSFKSSSQDSNHVAFPSVVETSFSVAPPKVSYSVDLTFDPTLFSNSSPQAPNLIVPQLTSTRSAIDDPSNPLFNGTTKGAH